MLTALALGLTLGVTGCTKIEWALGKVKVFAYMRSSPAFDPYEATRPAPPGAVPYESPGGQAVPAQGPGEAGLQALAAKVTNPVPADSANLAHGEVMYQRFCYVCHGTQGHGDGPVIGPGKFPFALNLTLPATVGRSDGYIYAVLREGRGLMPSYGARMSEKERWQIVNYVRQLQGAGGQTTTSSQATGAAAPAATQNAATQAARDTNQGN